MFFQGILLKEALRNVTIILWQSLGPVSMVLFLFKVLKQVLEFTMLVKEKYQ